MRQMQFILQFIIMSVSAELHKFFHNSDFFESPSSIRKKAQFAQKTKEVNGVSGCGIKIINCDTLRHVIARLSYGTSFEPRHQKTCFFAYLLHILRKQRHRSASCALTAQLISAFCIRYIDRKIPLLP